MPLETRTFQELYELARALLRSYVPGADVSPGSDYDLKARVLAAMYLGNQGNAEFIANQIFPESAEAAFVDRHAAARRIFARAAAKAIGTVLLTASSGTPTQPAGSELLGVDGTKFTTLSNATIIEPAWSGKSVVEGSTMFRIIVAPDVTGISTQHIIEINGEQRAIQAIQTSIGAIDLYEPLTVDPSAGTLISPVRGARVTVEASEPGAEGNKPVGDQLTLSAPVGAISPTARVQAMSGGANAETIEEVRARVVSHDQQPPGAGNPGFYRSISRATPSSQRIADAIVYPGFRGLGTVDIVPMGPSGARLVTTEQVSSVAGQIQNLGIYGDDVLVLAPTLGAYVRAEIEIEPETGFEPDWVGSFTITTGSSTTAIKVTTSPVGTIEIGDRVMIAQRIGANWFTFERTVSNVDPNTIYIVEPLPVAATVNPNAIPDIYPGGPLAAPATEAIDEAFDVLGPGTGTVATTIYSRFPKPSDEWDPVLRVSSLLCAVKDLSGVRDVHVTTINGLTPDDIVPDAQELLRRGQITVTFA